MTRMLEPTTPFTDEHRLCLHPHVDTAQPFDTAMDLTHNLILDRRYTVEARYIDPDIANAEAQDWFAEAIHKQTTPRRARHTAVTHTPIRTAPRVRRARTVGLGEVVVLVVAGLAVIGAGAVGRWAWGR